jgi:hypothetical protein
MFDPVTGHLFVEDPNKHFYACAFCFERYTRQQYMANAIPRCEGDRMAPKPKCSCINPKVQHSDSCPDFWPGGLKKNP